MVVEADGVEGSPAYTAGTASSFETTPAASPVRSTLQQGQQQQERGGQAAGGGGDGGSGGNGSEAAAAAAAGASSSSSSSSSGAGAAAEARAAGTATAAAAAGGEDEGAIEEVEVSIIGMGFSGLCVALRLREAGFGPIAGFEKAGSVGGTWAANTYPGCGCDVPSHLYSLSFEPSSDWTRMYPSQPEILAYLEGIARRRHLLPVVEEEGEEEREDGAAPSSSSSSSHRRRPFDPALYGAKQQGQAIVRLHTEVVEAKWEEPLRKWVVRTKNWATGVDGVVHSRFLITCLLGLAIPVYPVIEGIENFTGAAFHTARWDHSRSLKGKRVAVIGTGASAVQVVPAIVDECAHLTLFQRTPPYIMRKNDWAFPAPLRTLLKRLPLLRRALRLYIFWTHEVFAGAFLKPKESFLAWAATVYALAHLAWQTRGNPELRKRLTPNYQIGCKRALVSNDFYPALQRPNCTVVTAGVSEVKPLGWRPPPPPAGGGNGDDEAAPHQPPQPTPTSPSSSSSSSKPLRYTYPRPPSPPPPNGNMGNSDDAATYERRWADVEGEGEGEGGGGVIVDEEGNWHEVDVIVYATGFKVKDAMEQARVVGRDGVVLHEKFREQGWSSYLGVSVAGMPNFLMTMGSNTALGHNSVLLMMEGETNYILSYLQQMKRTGCKVACLKPAVEAKFMAEMHTRLESTVWQAGGCRSWYLTSNGGTSTDILWPGHTLEYMRRTWRASLRHEFDAWDRLARPMPGNTAPPLAPPAGQAKREEEEGVEEQGGGATIASTEQKRRPAPPRWENDGEGWLEWALGRLPFVFV